MGIMDNDIEPSQPGFETYINWWDSQWQSMIDQMPMHNGMTIDIAFDNWGQPLDPSSEARIVAMYQEIQKAAKKQGVSSIDVKLSFGGATYGMPTLNNPADAQNLANSLSSTLQHFKTAYGIDFSGVDLDVEAATNTEPMVAEFLGDLRNNLGQDKVISLTMPGQGWGTLYQQLAMDPSVQNNVSYFQMMEYDIWPGNSFVQQIEADVNTYIGAQGTTGPAGLPCWGIPADKLRLGLMPGKDDQGHMLTPEDATTLTDFAKAQGLSGVMIWDSFRDGEGTTGYSPFTFSNDIMNDLYPKGM